MVHRDIKPANLLIDARGQLWITDFGLARFHAEAGLTLTGDVLGTLRYMSPEQALARHDLVDHRTDIYSLGVTLYELLTLRPALEGRDRQELLRQLAFSEPPPPRQLNPAIPRELETILLKAMAKEPAERYTTPQELADDLGRFLEHRPIRARRPTLRERAGKWVRRHTSLVVSAFVLLGLAAAMLGVGTALIARSRSEAIGNLREARWQLYTNLVNRAWGEWSAGEPAVSAQLLEECPEEWRGWEWYFVKQLGHREQLTFRGHTGQILSMALRPDGRQVLTCAKGEVKLWNPETNRVIDVPGMRDPRRVAYSPSGELAAVGDDDGVVTLVRTGTGKRIRQVTPRGYGVRALAFASDGRRVAVARKLQSTLPGPLDVGLWGVDTLTTDRMFPNYSKQVDALAVRDDGQRIAFGEYEGPIRIFDPRTRQEPRILLGHTQNVYGLAYSVDGTTLASAGWDRTVRLWDPETGATRHILYGHLSFVVAVAFRPDGQQLASGSSDRTARLWDVASGREIATIRGHAGGVSNVAFSPDGRRLFTSGDSTVKVWDLQEIQRAQRMRHDQWVTSLAYSPDGQRLASASRDGQVKLWDARTGRELGVLDHDKVALNAVVFSRDGRLLATAAWDGEVRIWDARSYTLLRRIPGQESYVFTVAFSRDGRRLTSAGRSSGKVRIWETATGRNLKILTAHREHVFCVTFSPNGSLLASAGDDDLLKLWDSATLREVRSWPCANIPAGGGSKAGMIAFSPDGRRVAGCSTPEAGPNEVRVWDVETGRLVHALRGHSAHINTVQFSPDGTRIASASNDNTVKLWDAATGREVFTLRDDPTAMLSLAFRPDGEQLATGSTDFRIRLWNAPGAAGPAGAWIWTGAPSNLKESGQDDERP